MNKSITSTVTQTPFGEGRLMATNHITSDGPDSIWDQLQFRMLFTMVFTWFISAAILK